MVIAVANERAANDALTSFPPELMPESSSAMPTFETFEPRCPTTQRAAACSQEEAFEDIELQEWPTASRLAAINSAIAASSAETPPSRPKHYLAVAGGVSNHETGRQCPPRSLLARIWASDSERSLWEDMITVLGAVRALKGAKK